MDRRAGVDARPASILKMEKNGHIQVKFKTSDGAEHNAVFACDEQISKVAGKKVFTAQNSGQVDPNLPEFNTDVQRVQVEPIRVVKCVFTVSTTTI